MADDLDDAEFWLPPRFLGDDLFAEGDGTAGGGAADGGGAASEACSTPDFPHGWGYGSDLSSPVESMTGTESSDEEDYVAGLTRQMSQHSLQDGEKGPPSDVGADNSNATSVVGSPQSTLCKVWSWNSSSRDWEGSDGPSLVSSPLSSSLEQNNDGAWDTLYAGAGHDVQKGQSDESDQQAPENSGQGLLVTPAPKPSPPAQAALGDSGTTASYPNQPSTQHQVRVNQFQQPTHQQMAKQPGAGCWGRPKRPKGGIGLAGSRPGRPLGLSAAAWPPLQQVAGSRMRAVFLTPSSRRESSGTGVFLPRTAGSTTQLRKKPACSTALLPERVVQALNLDLTEIGVQPLFPGRSVLDRGGGDPMAARSKPVMPQKKDHGPQPAPASRHHREACLPSEWTY